MQGGKTDRRDRDGLVNNELSFCLMSSLRAALPLDRSFIDLSIH